MVPKKMPVKQTATRSRKMSDVASSGKPTVQKPKPAAETTEPPEVEAPIFANIHYGRYWFSFVVALGLLLASAYIAHKQIMPSWETRIFRHINDWPDKLRLPFKTLSFAKNSTWIATFAVIAVFGLRQWRLAWRLSVATIAGFVMTFGLKHFIHRPRPAQLINDVHLRWSDTGNGYPSGHVMIVTVILLVLLPYLPKFWRWLVIVAGLAAIGLSRIYLGLHAPLDVIGGFAVGLLIVSFLRILPRGLLQKTYLD